MICKKCGSNNPDNSNYCIGCAAFLESGQNTYIMTNPNPAVNQVTPQNMNNQSTQTPNVDVQPAVIAPTPKQTEEPKVTAPIQNLQTTNATTQQSHMKVKSITPAPTTTTNYPINNQETLSNTNMQNIQPPNTSVQAPAVPTHNNGKKIKKAVLITSLIFGIIILTLITTPIILNILNDTKDNNEPIPDFVISEKGTRTIMIYLIGSDLESQGGSATIDIAEIITSNFDTKDTNVIVYAGGTTNWQNTVFSENENAIYEIKGDDVKKLKSYSVKSMTKKETLTEFIDFVYEEYKTDLYSLILWDHGGGPVFGYGLDENVKKQEAMSILELNEALDDSKLMQETKFEFIGFDACLMSSIEVANILKEEAEYLIASSEIEPSFGWDYTFLSEVTSNTTSLELGQLIVDYYYEYYEDLKRDANVLGYNYNPEITLSLIKLDNIDPLIEELDILFADVDESINVNTYSKISQNVARSITYGTEEYDLVDLYDLVDELGEHQTKVDSVQKTIKEAIVYHRTTIDNCEGLSMYFPITTRAQYKLIESLYNYDDMIVSKNYQNFLKKYVNISTGNKLVTSDITALVPTIEENAVQATLPQDVAENFESGSYIVFRKIKDDGSFLPIYKSTDVALNGNTISATVSNRRISVGSENSSDNLDVIAIEYARDETSVTYVVATVLQRWDDEDYFGTNEFDSVNLYIKVDNQTNKGEIIDIRPINDDTEESNLSAKTTYNLNEWRIMAFAISSYFLQDENGNKLDEWEKTSTMYGTDLIIADGYNFFASELDQDEEYYYMFMVKDTQGNQYETNLVTANYPS